MQQKLCSYCGGGNPPYAFRCQWCNQSIKAPTPWRVRVGWALIIMGMGLLALLTYGWYVSFLNIMVERVSFPLDLALSEYAFVLLLVILPGVLLVRMRRHQ